MTHTPTQPVRFWEVICDGTDPVNGDPVVTYTDHIYESRDAAIIHARDLGGSHRAAVVTGERHHALIRERVGYSGV